MNPVELDHATLTLGERIVLADASFAIRAGEFIGVLGPNGAGKTTLMRAILGLLPPSAGTIRVFGNSPQRGDHAIGYLPQVRTVLPDLRVRGLDFIGSSLHGERWRWAPTGDPRGARTLAVQAALSDALLQEAQRLLQR